MVLNLRRPPSVEIPWFAVAAKRSARIAGLLKLGVVCVLLALGAGGCGDSDPPTDSSAREPLDSSDDVSPEAESASDASDAPLDEAAEARTGPGTPARVSDGYWETPIEGDMVEVSQFEPETASTPEQLTAADSLVEEVKAAVEHNGWADFDKALADGFRRHEGDPIHYVNQEYLTDGSILDPTKPEYLVFIDRPTDVQLPKGAGEKVLAGVMFLMDTVEGRGPQPGGNEMIWHYHDFLGRGACLVEPGVALGRRAKDGSCDTGTLSQRSPEMIHVWIHDNPNGRFASSMALEPETLFDISGEDPEVEFLEALGETDVQVRAGDVYFDNSSYRVREGDIVIGAFNAGVLPTKSRSRTPKDSRWPSTDTGQPTRRPSNSKPGRTRYSVPSQATENRAWRPT